MGTSGFCSDDDYAAGLHEDIEQLRAALAGAVEAWDRWYPKLPACTETENDEFGAIQTARNLLRSAAS